MTRFVTQTFLKGLAVLLPIVAGVYVLAWLIGDTEGAVRGLITGALPEGYESYYIPGMGLVALLIVTWLCGLLMYPWITRRLLDRLDQLLRRIPLFNMIYAPVRDLLDMFGGDMTQNLGQPVLITIPGTQVRTLGFVTRDTVDDLPEGFPKDDYIVCYVQWSSQVGGYCFILPRDSVESVDMTIEEGMRWALTAGVSYKSRNGGK